MTDALRQRRIVLLLEYDGTRFAGSQYQPDVRTVQSEVEKAITKTTGENVRIALAGRTDAGVHAKGQVASFLTESALAVETLQRALNAWLPEDIVVRACSIAALDLDVRRHAVSRRYRYLIENRPERPVIDRQRVWHVRQPLNAEAMARAAARLVGTHDFRAFAGALEDAEASTVRELQCFSVRRIKSRVVCELQANAFLPHQVRRMVGSLVEVGKGQMTPEAYEAQLDGAASSAGPAAPANGLCLMAVEYAQPLFRMASE